MAMGIPFGDGRLGQLFMVVHTLDLEPQFD